MKKMMAFTLVSTLFLGTGSAFAAAPQNGSIQITGNGQSTQNINITNETNVTNNNYRITFEDINGHWAKDAIEQLAKKGILAGDEKGRFNPENKVTREQFAKMISVFFGLQAKDTTQNFADVPTDRWSFKFVDAAQEYITAYKAPDGDLLFKPDMPEMRQDVTVSLIKLLQDQGNVKVLDAQTADTILKAVFKDWEKIAPAYRPYVATAVQMGLVKGIDGKFNPFDTLTRAQAATLLVRVQNQSAVVVGDQQAPSAEQQTGSLPSSGEAAPAADSSTQAD